MQGHVFNSTDNSMILNRTKHTWGKFPFNSNHSFQKRLKYSWGWKGNVRVMKGGLETWFGGLWLLDGKSLRNKLSLVQPHVQTQLRNNLPENVNVQMKQPTSSWQRFLRIKWRYDLTLYDVTFHIFIHRIVIFSPRRQRNLSSLYSRILLFINNSRTQQLWHVPVVPKLKAILIIRRISFGRSGHIVLVVEMFFKC